MVDLKEKEKETEKVVPRYVALDEVAKELGVHRSTMYYYLERLSIKPKKFPLDRRKYITVSDLQRIKDMKQAAIERRH